PNFSSSAACHSGWILGSNADPPSYFTSEFTSIFAFPLRCSGIGSNTFLLDIGLLWALTDLKSAIAKNP
ncbi:MAG: hypothetical protein VYA05_04755, partial [Pseudomonadota bacterium]|nr:hypothetical protein [Pseudomonadota bacterium]